MRDKKKLLALLLFLIMGFFMFTFANPSDGISTLPKLDEETSENDKDKENNEEDKEDNQSQVVVTVDNAPVINIEPKTVSIAYGTDYNVMTGVIVNDDNDKDLVATPSFTNTKELEVGTYTITYTVIDRAGNTATASRTLIVFEDKNNNNIPDEEEKHYDVNFEASENGSLNGTTNYANILTGLTFEQANIEIPEVVPNEYYEFIEWTPVVPGVDTVVLDNVTYTATFGPINDENNNGIADEEETYKLTIDYVYSRGEKINTINKDVVYLMSYSVTTPEIKYYKADKAIVEGVMPKEDVTVTVTYTPINDENNNGIADEEETYKLTIDYVYSRGEKINTINKDVVYLMSYSVTTPEIKYYKADKAIVEGVMPKEDVTVTVTYTPINDENNNGIADEEEEFTVTFVDENDNIIGDVQIVKYGEDAVAPIVTKEDTVEYHYTFTGWDKDYTNVKSDLVVKAIFNSEIRKYEVTFVDYDGTVIGDVQSIPYGTSAVKPLDPTRENYTFTGWDKDYTNIVENTTIRATYIANQVGLIIVEKPNANFEFQQSSNNNDQIIRELIIVKKVFADGHEEVTTTYTTDFDRTTVGNKTLTVSENGFTATHSYKVTSEEAFQSKFEVKWETLNVCVRNCGFDFKHDVYADINAFRVIEHYNQLIQIKRIDVTYTNDKVNNNIYISDMVDYSRYAYNDELGRYVYYDPEYDAYLQNGNKGVTVAQSHDEVKYVDITYVRTGAGDFENGEFKVRFERQSNDTFKAISEEKIS